MYVLMEPNRCSKGLTKFDQILCEALLTFQAQLEVSPQPLRSPHGREAERRAEADRQRVVQPEVRPSEGQRLEGN